MQGLMPTPTDQLEDIDPDSIALGRELGQGEFGSVLMGVWTNPNGKKVHFVRNFFIFVLFLF